jgi:hypothetical protein
MQFLSEWEWEGKVNGYFTLNSDVRYFIQNDGTQVAAADH